MAEEEKREADVPLQHETDLGESFTRRSQGQRARKDCDDDGSRKTAINQANASDAEEAKQRELDIVFVKSSRKLGTEGGFLPYI